MFATAPKAEPASCCAYPPIAAHARTIEEFVPTGWSIEAESRGTLDEDHRDAISLLLRSTARAKSDVAPSTLPRILAVVERANDGSYDLVLQNHALIPRLENKVARDVDYDLKRGPQILGGVLKVKINRSIMVGSTAEVDQTFTFRRSNGRFVLIGYDEGFVTYHQDTGSVSVNYLTNKFSRTVGVNCAGRKDVVKRCKPNTTWQGLKPAPLLSIDQVGNGFAFHPTL